MAVTPSTARTDAAAHSAGRDAGPEAADAALLARLRAGEEGAYEALVRSYGPRLLATAQRLLRHDDDARDAVQDAFLSAFRALGQFAGDARLSTWLHRIVVNAALMKLRTRRRKPESSIDALLPKFLDDGHQAEPVSEWKRAAESPMEQAQTRALVRACIDQLPESHRTVLVLREIEEQGTEETAAILGLSPSAVKTRLHRARQALRQLLDPHLRNGSLG